MHTPDMAKATSFLWLHARLIDRLRYEYLFQHGRKRAVLEALSAYQNEDGGFGHALEPDMRGPISQPEHVEIALHILDELEALDSALVEGLCNYLETITTAEGGVPYVLPGVMQYPRAPWWQSTEQPPASLNPTAGIVGILLKHHITHPWVERAATYCWREIEAKGVSEMHEARTVLLFLEGIPDEKRALKTIDWIGSQFQEKKLVTLEPGTGYAFSPLDYAPRPTDRARRLFDDKSIEQALDILQAGQQEDGGWSMGWEPWTPLTAFEWRGWITVDALKVLRSNGRIN